jgi:hypothetical protein
MSLEEGCIPSILQFIYYFIVATMQKKLSSNFGRMEMEYTHAGVLGTLRGGCSKRNLIFFIFSLLQQ